ncbi:CS1 type fimbrial major subunit [Pseudomonas lurida]|uniref:CS1 type fimbrial major subunit n=1 Tax=Pseudomonas lurida TaxID=244566 RepID=UPI0027338D12|nr:CS1 type fimbrial major subunit [Pseudomonas lurida]WLG29637.1 CS1 type fimbrial major subunit [Pseudomonas lurida]
MTLLKKISIAPFAFAAVLASAHAVADPITHTIQLEAFVPTDDFYVLPVDSSWITNKQTLSYSTVTKKLTSLTKPFTVLNIAGPIKATLLSDAVLGSGSNVIQLAVKFNGIALDTEGKEVVSKTQAAKASTVNLEITPTMPSGGYIPGTYVGNVQLSFDAVL